MDNRPYSLNEDEYGQISDVVMRYFDAQAEAFGWGRYDTISTDLNNTPGHDTNMAELEELQKQLDVKILAAFNRVDDFSFTNNELRWADGSIGRPSVDARVCESSVQEEPQTNKELVSIPKKTLDEHLRFLFSVPDGEDTKEWLKAIPISTKQDIVRAIDLARQIAHSFGEQVNVEPKTLVKAAASVTAVGVLAAGIASKADHGTEQAMGGDGSADISLIVDRKAEQGKAIIEFNPNSQDVQNSERAAEELLAVAAEDVVIDGNRIKFQGEVAKLSDEALIAATLEAQRPDTKAEEGAATTPTSEPEKPKFPSTPEEKFAAEKVAIKNALDHAIETNDLGPLNNIVVNSPIFQPRYDLPGDLENGKIRTMPPSNLLDIEDLVYEFAKGAPDKERNATSEVITSALADAYKLRKTIKSNPVFLEKYPDACVRMGDFSAEEDHHSHWGSQIDETSALHCDIENSRSQADGPVFWINHTGGGIDKNITNPVHDEELDNIMLEFVTSQTIDGVTVVKNILYSKPNSPDRVNPYENHSNHIHKNVKPAYRDMELKHFSIGGERPERDLTKLTSQILTDYESGVGVDGISKTPEVVDPVENYNKAIMLLLDEIASGEGSWDSVNRGKSSDTLLGTKEGQAVYKQIFGNRMLSDLTIKEVLDLQRKKVIFAVGRYQMIGGKMKDGKWQPGTLESAVSATGIDVNRKFDESAQNELAINYLIMQKRPDLVKYIKSESNDIDAALLSLAQEWASLPAPHSYNIKRGRPLGSSYYYNDSAGNKSKGGQETVDRLTMILVHLRDVYQKKDNTPLPDSVSPPVSPQPQVTSENKDVVGIGDSLTYGLELVGMENMDSNGVNIVDINGRSGRSLAGSPSKDIPDNGVMVLDKMITEGKIKDAEFVYLALGTNKLESNEVFENELRKSIVKISQVSNAKVLIPLLFSNVKHKDSRNEIITRVARETGAQVIDPGAGIKFGDKEHIHPGPDGYKEMAKRIIAEVNNTPINPPKVTIPAATPTTMPTEHIGLETTPGTPSVTKESIADEKVTDNTIGKFSKEQAREIYKVWFEDKVEVDGKMVTVLDEEAKEALDTWMDGLKPKKGEDGQEFYEIDYNILPERR